MTFPDGRIKDGYFENNVFKGNTHVTEGSAAEAKLHEGHSTGPFEMAQSLPSDASHAHNASLNETRTSQNRAPREVRIKTRGGSNSVRRAQQALNEQNQYHAGQGGGTMTSS